MHENKRRRKYICILRHVLGNLRIILYRTKHKRPFDLLTCIGPSCYPSYSQDRLCSASCRKSSFFHALLENCHAPQYLATRPTQQSSFNFAIFFERFISLRERRDGILKKTNQNRDKNCNSSLLYEMFNHTFPPTFMSSKG